MKKAEEKASVEDVCMNDNDADYIKRLFEQHPKATKVIFDANVFNYSVQAKNSIGVNLFEYLVTCEDFFNWYVIEFEAIKLLKSGYYRPDIMAQHILPGDDYGIMKINGLPHIDESTGKLEFWNLNTLSFGDAYQIFLAHNFLELSIITNDSKLFKSGQAALGGRVIPFHTFIGEIPYWRHDENWQKLVLWFNDNISPLRNNSSWKLTKKDKVKIK